MSRTLKNKSAERKSSKKSGITFSTIKSSAKEKNSLYSSVGNSSIKEIISTLSIQSKLRTNQSGDKYEKEADRVAQQVVDSGSLSSNEVSLHTKGIQRKCSSCANGGGTCSGCAEEEEVHRKEKPGASTQVEQPSKLFNTGAPLGTRERKFFEPRFGQNFENVRLHTDNTANRSADMLNARAFTLGNNIAFGRGEYRPETNNGKRLIAHELTHVVQQRGSNNFIQREEDVRGTSKFRETVLGNPKEDSPNIWKGRVEREEYIPKTKDEEEKRIHSGIVDLEFDSKKCEIRIPYKVKFEKPSKKNFRKCTGDEKLTKYEQPSEEIFNKVSQRFLDASNKWLNDWYVARIEGCEVGCANKDIPIKVVMEKSESNPDDTVVITTSKGRSCVSGNIITLKRGNDISEYTLAHEAGHAVLEHGDEYKNEGRPLERVREEDWSLMAEEKEYKRRSLLHLRHFQFVPPFLKKIYKNCKVSLKENSTPFVLSYNPTLFGIGFGKYAGSTAFFIRTGIDFGIPLNRLKTLELMLGINNTFLLGMDTPSLVSYFSGVRAGLLYSHKRWDSGISMGAVGEFGGGYFQAPKEIDSDFGSRGRRFESVGGWLPYTQVGGQFGYRLLGMNPEIFMNLEGKYGQTIGKLDFNDAKVLRWFNFGLNMTLMF